ncbi:uncharacterized protein LOC129921228 [Episyrphus balteatus]|uniref:uncharacterized protein LOC129921228 n=1 Tax=Episyrphus balteatus TaxID=286459 RepID=UPI002485B620|nr:uncharacterized protein LOC129921228 [Episyrphus balteatus]
MTFLTYLINECNEQYDLIISAILFSKTNILHPSIITPKRFIDELLNNTHRLNNGKSFPLPLEYDNSFKLIEISKLKAFYKENKLVFVIQTPLVTYTEFNLYKLHPLPVPLRNNSFIFINPSANYLAISVNKLSYITIEDKESNCKNIYNDKTICENNIIKSTTTSPTCETKLIITLNKNIPEQCNTKILQGYISIWHPLKNNIWIFVSPQEKLITISCKDEDIKDDIIKGIGLFKLQPDCRAYSASHQIISTTKISTEYNHIFPDIPIFEDDCCGELKSKNKSKLFLSPINLSNIRLDELKTASSKINKIEENMDKLFNDHIQKANNGWFKMAMQFLVSAVAIIIILYCLSCCGCFRLIQLICCRHNQNDPCLVKIYNNYKTKSNPHDSGSSEDISLPYTP